MHDSEIDALAKGMVPFVREVVTEARAPLMAHLAEVEARPVEKGEAGAEGPQGQPGPEGPEGPPGPKGDAAEPVLLAEAFAKTIVPSELSEQIKAAIHLLHESPPIVRQNAPPRSAYPLPPPRPNRIERNDNGGYTLIYDEPAA